MDFGISSTQMGADGDWFREFVLLKREQMCVCVCVCTGLCMPVSSHMYVEAVSFLLMAEGLGRPVFLFSVTHPSLVLIIRSCWDFTCSSVPILQLWSCSYHNSPSMLTLRNILGKVWPKFLTKIRPNVSLVCWTKLDLKNNPKYLKELDQNLI